MKFGKEFAAQMIPEWQQAYMDYASLKTILKEIQTSRKTSARSGVLSRKLSSRNNFSVMARRYNRSVSSHELENNQDIMVNTMTGEDGFEKYETIILKVAEPGRESELLFFKTLDLEFDKVNRFYKSKVVELVKEAVVLNKQMDALIAFRIKVNKPSSSWSCSETLSVDMDALDSKEETEIGVREEEIIPNLTGDPTTESVPEALSILERIKINKEETPLSTIRNVLKLCTHEELNFTRENLKKIEERLKNVFIEFYRKLRHLKNYKQVVSYHSSSSPTDCIYMNYC